MLKLKIIRIEEFCYTLQDCDGNIYHGNIEFYDLANNPSINDTIYINEDLIKQIDNQTISFGLLDDMHGKLIKSAENIDIVILKSEKGKLYLKRIYG